MGGRHVCVSRLNMLTQRQGRGCATCLAFSADRQSQKMNQAMAPTLYFCCWSTSFAATSSVSDFDECVLIWGSSTGVFSHFGLKIEIGFPDATSVEDPIAGRGNRR